MAQSLSKPYFGMRSAYLDLVHGFTPIWLWVKTLKFLVNLRIGGKWMFIYPKMES